MDDGIQSGESAENARDVSRLGDVHLVGKQFAAANMLSLGNALLCIESHRNYMPAPHGEHSRRRLADATRTSGDQCHQPSIILGWFHMHHYRAVMVPKLWFDDTQMVFDFRAVTASRDAVLAVAKQTEAKFRHVRQWIGDNFYELWD